VILANYLAAATLFSLGAFAVLARRDLIKIIMGLSLMEASTYVLLVSMAYRRGATAPVLAARPTGVSEKDLVHGNVADPVLQNFCLTAIVIGVAITAVFLTVAVRAAQHYRSVDANDVRGLRG
jgi:multicomponent Na+:H+ antiporter subunit C